MDIAGETFISESDGHQFRITFDVIIKPGNSVSFADIRIYNLSKSSTITQGDTVTFRAGFSNVVDTIFTGFVTNTFREREGADVITRLACISGDAREDRGSVAASYGSNVLLTDIIKGLAKAWPRRLSMDDSQFDDVPPLSSGYVADGDIPTQLDKLKNAFDFEWTQDLGRLMVTRVDKPRKGVITEISQFTGMIGIPEVTGGPEGIGVFVINTLNPYFRIDGRINIKSEFSTFNTGNIFVSAMTGDAKASGEYNIFQMRHRGDSWGNQWVTEIDAKRAGTAQRNKLLNEPSGDSTAPSTTGALIWGESVNADFRTKTREIAGRLRFQPNWLMAVMAFETGRTFDPAERNRAGGSATGLIQFMPDTAKQLGTTTARLARMTAVEQLDYVEKYYEPAKSRINNLADCYIAVLAGVNSSALGKPDDYILWRYPSREYNANRPLDVKNKGYITKGDAAVRVDEEMRRGVQYAR
jgi:hypothetical protein